MRMSLAESFDSLMKRLQGAVHGGAGIFKNLGEGLRCGNGGGPIGDVAGSVETGMAGDDCSAWSMGGLDGRHDRREGIQASLRRQKHSKPLALALSRRVCTLEIKVLALDNRSLWRW